MLLALLLIAGALIEFAEIDLERVQAMGYREPGLFAVLLVLLQAVPVAFRRRLPTAALVVAAIGFLIDRYLNYPSSVAIFGFLFVFHAVGSELPRRKALVVGWAGVGLMTVFTTVGVFQEIVSVGQPLVVLIFTSFPLLLGLESRQRRTAEAQLAVRARQLEFDNIEATQQERARIARELHDVVAHEMTVATIQAAAARRLIDSDSEAAAHAIEAAERAGHEGLAELRRSLGVLRTSEPASRSPQPGLEQLDSLADQMREAGLTVAIEIEGDPKGLSPGADLNAYRIVQEALTNALKHAGPGVSVAVTIAYRPDGIDIVVADDGRGAADPADGTGVQHGLISMRERATMLGGTLDALPVPDGGFCVSASIPGEYA